MIGTKLWLVYLDEWDGREFMGRSTWGPFTTKPTDEQTRDLLFRSLVKEACDDGEDGADARETATDRLDDEGNDYGVEELVVADLNETLKEVSR